MNKKSIIIKMDGNAWCAHREDFVDLQASVAGFGPHPIGAVENLLYNEGIEELRHSKSDHA